MTSCMALTQGPVQHEAELSRFMLLVGLSKEGQESRKLLWRAQEGTFQTSLSPQGSRTEQMLNLKSIKLWGGLNIFREAQCLP